MIFLDNSASSRFKPPEVIEAVQNALKIPYNPARSCHWGSHEAGFLVHNARKIFAEAFGIQTERVIFCGGCTEALNLAIFGTAKKGGHVITTVFEHNSVLRPLFKLRNMGVITLSVVSSPAEARAALKRNTYLLAVNHVSNVTGFECDIAGYANLARQGGLLFLVDAAQSAGYKKIDMVGMGIDILTFAPHKGLHGIQGAGALGVSERVFLRPIKHGGTGSGDAFSQPSDYPDGFEAGTLPTPAISAAGAGVLWSLKHLEENALKMRCLSERIVRGLQDINGVKVYSDANDCGIAAFNVGRLTSGETGDICNERYGIAIRCGFHCAPLLHEFYGTKSGMVRASVGVETQESEIDEFLKAIKEIAAASA